MLFHIAWPDGTRTRKRIASMRQLDDFVAAQYSSGLDVELRPTNDGPLLIIGDALFETQSSDKAQSTDIAMSA